MLRISPCRCGALRQQGVVVSGKKLRRLMREYDLQPKRRRRYVTTTDSDHAGPTFPDLAKGVVADGPNQVWVAAGPLIGPSRTMGAVIPVSRSAPTKVVVFQ